MTPEEHYRAAEEHLTAAEANLSTAGNRLAAANVHALLALAGNPLIESATTVSPPAFERPRPGRQPRGAVA